MRRIALSGGLFLPLCRLRGGNPTGWRAGVGLGHAACGRDFDKSLDKHMRELWGIMDSIWRGDSADDRLVGDDLMMDYTMVHMRGWGDHHDRKSDRWDAGGCGQT